MTPFRAKLFPLGFFPVLAVASIPISFPVAAQDAAPPAVQTKDAGQSALPDSLNADDGVKQVIAQPDPASGMMLEVQSIQPLDAEQVPKVDPVALYGGDVVFDVYRKGSKIGAHRASFARSGNQLTVTAQMELNVDVLFFTAYSFKYDATEVWRDDKLVAVAATVDDNGKIAKTTGRLEDDLFKIDGPRGSFIASSWVFPTNHWHRGQAISGTVLNTLNGRFAKVEMVHKGLERVETKQGPVDAERLQYTGQLRDVDVWYDASNRWVKMTFKARDGSLIEYRCRQCGLAPREPDTAPATMAGDDTPGAGVPEQSANDPS